MVVVWWDADKQRHRWARGVNAGHYIGRGKKFLRWDDYNVHLQCARCNGFDDQVSVLRQYRKNLCMKIGEEGVSDLETSASNIYKPRRDELEEIIKTSKKYVSFTLVHPDGVEQRGTMS